MKKTKSCFPFSKHRKSKILFCTTILLLSTQLSFSQTLLSVKVNAANDDLEEYIAGATLNGVAIGDVDAGSSDLELGEEDPGENSQLIGIRFNNITIPKGAVISKAYIQFTVDATAKNAGASNLTLIGEANDNALTFDPTLIGNLNSRPKTTTSVNWTIPAGTWTVVGEAGANQQTSDIKSIIQEIIDRSGWASGNSLALYVSGTGTKEAESADGNNPGAPKLVVEYYLKTTLNVKITADNDDMEEYIAGATVSGVTIGDMDAGSSDLELGEADPGKNSQLVGMRFNNITIPQNTIITKAYLQFTVDATGKNTDPSNLTIFGEATDNAVTFDPTTKFNLSSRPKTTSTVAWNIPTGTWSTVGIAEADQQSSDIKSVIQEIVNRSGWTSGNSLALYITGTGVREAESADGNNPGAVRLIVEYLGAGDPIVDPNPTGNPVSNFPITKKSSWSYLDLGADPGSNWKLSAFTEDNKWSFGEAPLGYGDAGLKTTVSYGSDANNKHITTFFLKRFKVSGLASLASTLELNLLCDDGAIVYLNGVEIARKNMPTGATSLSTTALSPVDGVNESLYHLYEINKSLLFDGDNIIAVELHQSAATSSDISFDLELVEAKQLSNPAAMGCDDDDEHIACFTSVLPTPQQQTMIIPSTHTWQVIFTQGETYKTGTGTAPGNNDFTGFIPENMTNSTKGHLSINHETNPGGLSMLDLHYSTSTEKWVVDNSEAVSFEANSIVKTDRPCSGGVTPWETVITCEETMAAGDVNGDGYEDVGWHVEIDPKTKKIKEYGNGKQEKLWAMGRMSHENIAVMKDSLTAYYGDDVNNGNIFKFVASNKMNFSSGTLYVLKLNSGLSASEPTSSIGTWVMVPNSTIAERNGTKASAIGLGATTFNGVEDVEVGTVDGKIYFTAKGESRVYRFKDNGTSVTEFETFVGGKAYRINFGTGVISEDWGSGNDNLTFDDKGNLWVLQDGSRNHIWMVRPTHTQADPKVELFMVTPNGSEPTGMTFTPDYKFMFLSIQSPSGSNTETQTDATGTAHVFNKATTVVIGRKDKFDGVLTSNMETENLNKFNLSAYPNPSKGEFKVSFKLDKNAEVQAKLVDLTGRIVDTFSKYNLAAGEHTIEINSQLNGTYVLQLIINGESISRKVVLN